MQKLLVVACSLARVEPGPLHWELEVLSSGLPGSSLPHGIREALLLPPLLLRNIKEIADCVKASRRFGDFRLKQT